MSSSVEFITATVFAIPRAVMKEAMKCFPFLTLLLERVVPSDGATITGTRLPPCDRAPRSRLLW
jgi:hypothetical protein